MLFTSSVISLDSAPDAVQDFFVDQGWTDGLPIVPPEPGLVERMIQGSGLDPAVIIGEIAPGGAAATVEKIAINATMAGCRPEYMPVVVAAIRALADPAFNLSGVQATTHPVGPMIIVNGPIRHRIGINCGSNVFGQGYRANATIGRAVRLIMMNIGQGIPGKTDMSTMGTPCKFSFCGGENEEQSPWEACHVERGFLRTDSTVMLHAAEAPHNVQDHGSTRGDELLMTISDAMNSIAMNNFDAGGEVMVVLSPEHAQILARDGLTKTHIKNELHRLTRVELGRIGSGKLAFSKRRRAALNVGPEVSDVPLLDDPKQIIVVVAGGSGLHSMVVPSYGTHYSTIAKIDDTSGPA